jgi:hypothetical protein
LSKDIGVSFLLTFKLATLLFVTHPFMVFQYLFNLSSICLIVNHESVIFFIVSGLYETFSNLGGTTG